nr:hypothetical protein [Tanacetum cinerariifolium]
MRIEQSWEVIKNGNKVLTKPVGSSEQTYEPTTTEEKQDKKNEMKARGTLLMALSNKDQLKFHSYQDAKLLMEAIEKRYGGNKESKKRNTAELETISLDDLYNNLKIYEPEISRSSNTNQNPQNMAFVSLQSTSSTNEADTTASRVSTAHTQEDLEQIDPDNLEEIDLHWEMAMLIIRARRFMKRTGRSLDMNGRRIGFDKTKVECFNCHKNGYFARERRALRNQDNRGGYDWSYQAEKETPTNYAFMALTSSGSSSSSNFEVDSCSKTRMKAYVDLKNEYDSLTSDYKKSQHNLFSYKAGLQSVEERLVHYTKNEVVFTEKINVLNLEVKLRDKVLAEYTQNLEKVEKERDELKLTLEKLQN